MDTFLVYLPSNTSIRLATDLGNYRLSLIDLANKNVHTPTYMVKNGQTIFPTHNCLEDVLIVARKKIIN